MPLGHLQMQLVPCTVHGVITLTVHSWVFLFSFCPSVDPAVAKRTMISQMFKHPHKIGNLALAKAVHEVCTEGFWNQSTEVFSFLVLTVPSMCVAAAGAVIFQNL